MYMHLCLSVCLSVYHPNNTAFLLRTHSSRDDWLKSDLLCRDHSEVPVTTESCQCPCIMYTNYQIKSIVSYPEMAASFWCAWRAISQPLVLVLCISARSEGQLTETSPIEMTNSRYRATCVLNSWTSWKTSQFLSLNIHLSSDLNYFCVHKRRFHWPLSGLAPQICD